MKKQLIIKECQPKSEIKSVKWDWINLYYDLKTKILIYELYVEKELESNIIYDFIFQNDEDTDVNSYVVLKKLGANKYLVSEFYNNKFYSQKNQNLLGESWIHIKDFEKEFNIIFEKIRRSIINFNSNIQTVSEKYLLIDVYANKVICNCVYTDLEQAKLDLDAEFYCFTSDDNNLEYGIDCWEANDRMSAWANLNGKDRIWSIIKVPR